MPAAQHPGCGRKLVRVRVRRVREAGPQEVRVRERPTRPRAISSMSIRIVVGQPMTSGRTRFQYRSAARFSARRISRAAVRAPDAWQAPTPRVRLLQCASFARTAEVCPLPRPVQEC